MSLPAVSPLRLPPHREEPFATQLCEVSQCSECGSCRRGGGRNSWSAHRLWAGGSFLSPKIPSQGKWASWHWPWPSSPWRRIWGGPITTGGSDRTLKPIKLMPCTPDSWGQETFSGLLRAPLGERLCLGPRAPVQEGGTLGAQYLWSSCAVNLGQVTSFLWVQLLEEHCFLF